MTFNGTLTGNAPIIVEVMQGADSITGGLLGAFMLLLIVGIVYYRNRTEPTREALTGAIWVGLIVAVLMRVIGLLSDFYLGVMIVAAIGTLIMMTNRD